MDKPTNDKLVMRDGETIGLISASLLYCVTSLNVSVARGYIHDKLELFLRCWLYKCACGEQLYGGNSTLATRAKAKCQRQCSVPLMVTNGIKTIGIQKAELIQL